MLENMVIKHLYLFLKKETNGIMPREGEMDSGSR
jgi:hypothetical protein